MKIKLNEKELIELGGCAARLQFSTLSPKSVGETLVMKLNEIKSRKIITHPYLKISQVKFNTREKINQISENATANLINQVLEIHLKRKPTLADLKKVRFSHEANENHKRFVYFPEGKYLGEFSNIKDGEFFKLVFKFGD